MGIVSIADLMVATQPDASSGEGGDIPVTGLEDMEGLAGADQDPSFMTILLQLQNWLLDMWTAAMGAQVRPGAGQGS